MNRTAEERRPPRFAVALGVPEDAVAVASNRSSVRWVKGNDVWSFDPRGRLTHVTWAEPAPPAPIEAPQLSIEAALSRRPQNFEEWSAQMQARGLAVQLGMIAPMPPRQAPQPDRPATDSPKFQAHLAALAELENSPAAMEARERSAKLTRECENEYREELQWRARGEGRMARRAADELDRMNRRDRERGDRL